MTIIGVNKRNCDVCAWIMTVLRQSMPPPYRAIQGAVIATTVPLLLSLSWPWIGPWSSKLVKGRWYRQSVVWLSVWIVIGNWKPVQWSCVTLIRSFQSHKSENGPYRLNGCSYRLRAPIDKNVHRCRLSKRASWPLTLDDLDRGF